MRTSQLLTIVIALQGLILAGQWLGSPSYLTSAQAQMADPARDRQQMVDQLQAINGKLEKLTEILASGNLQVRVIQPDETKGSSPAR